MESVAVSVVKCYMCSKKNSSLRELQNSLYWYICTGVWWNLCDLEKDRL